MKREYLVSKSNKLVSSNYDLSLQEQKIILTLVSLIDTTKDNSFNVYEMKISEFCELVGLENTNHTYIRKITKKLMTRVLEIEEPERVLQTHWLSSCEYMKNTGYVKLELHRELIPYLLQLKSKFTSYYLSNVLKMKSKYSIRLYEILKSHQYKREVKIEVEALKKMLKCENYVKYANLKQKVLDVAVKEINSNTDLFVEYEPEKQGRKVWAVKFMLYSSFAVEAESWETKLDLDGTPYEQRVLL